MAARNYISIVLGLMFFQMSIAQSSWQKKSEGFLKPADTLNKGRRNAVVLSETVLAAGALYGLSTVWYDDYEKSDFHFINDNAHWLQMDKAGHVFSSYHLGRFGYEALEWAGARHNDRLIYGSTIGFAFLTAVEVFDGYSAEWGASLGDIAANAGGTALFVGQELLWHEQRIIPKFSFHETPYASVRPNVLGRDFNEQLFKDYNGQTYWLSVNVHSFFKQSKVPKWLNIAFGYGAQGMITADDVLVNTVFLPEKQRFRQYYLSLDLDLTKFETKSHFWKTVFSVVNTIKVPAPALEINEKGITKFHAIYF